LDGFETMLEAMNTLDRGKEVKAEIKQWIDALGMQFLTEVQNQILHVQAVDTRRLINSFHRGGAGAVWKKQNRGLSLQVGTNVEYARYVNDGHRTRVARGTQNVPRWVEGRHYFDTALRITEAMMEKSLEKKLDKWIDKVWGK
jgi:hypothetical protein